MKLKKLLAWLNRKYLQYKMKNGTFNFSDEFYMAKCVLIAINIYEDLLVSIIDDFIYIHKLQKEYDMESKKDYSDRKYEVYEEITDVINRYNKNLVDFTEQISLKYYEVTGNELLDDCNHLLKTIFSDEDSNVRRQVKMLRDILNNSPLNTEMGNLLRESIKKHLRNRK